MATRYSEYTIESAGTSIVLSVWQADKADASIVFIPATMVHPLFYAPLLGGFAGHGFHVVGVHPVGHGKSPRGEKKYTLSDIVQNGRDAVTFALERFGMSVIVMGSSQGGVAAAALAAADNRIAAAFPHNIMLTELADSIGISRFPKFLRCVYKPAKGIFRLFATILPELKLPLGFYLKRKRISENPVIWDMVERDPLCLKRYSLRFLASLFLTEFPGLTNGGIQCPLYVVADRGDKLFTYEYTQKVFELLRAPYKELIEFHFNDHMLMVTHPEAVCERLSTKMKAVISGVAKAITEEDL
ncbi:MAG: lysophospholipase [Oscillospiraceae bacterium]|jgi:alpha-beta hydrolase superfamily lysophospholipase|nr:lysophospholipase [Oscillospiraceae bacterium]